MQSRYYGNTSQTASFGGYRQVVRLLLEKNAKADAQATVRQRTPGVFKGRP
ncbi:hypothetical protein EJ02DRAFT_479809 [Clathrospora elynae]|uniref:Uncharacterized protein n=1 Tax=Clathrospora elynae TaxID=706981 RepID=A0A6A5SGV5_9PLEO|nr:hypothetical protein EJ02DRAFT_479809 [Clathrospora elynae]